MRYSISHLGVPIGDVDLSPTETAVGELVPVAGYSAIEETVRAGSRALWAAGFLSVNGAGAEVDPVALGRAAALTLELRDDRGALVPADFINIVERPTPGEPPIVFVRFRLAPSQVPSIRNTPEIPGGHSEGRDA